MDKKTESNNMYNQLVKKKQLGEMLDFNNIQPEELNLLFYNHSAGQIAELYETTESKVRYKMKKWGINLRNQIVDDFFDNPERFAELHADARKDLKTLDNLTPISKAITHFAFRNGPVENMHADGKLSEKDMMTLNKFMVNRLAYVFSLIIDERWAEFEFLVEMTNKWYGHDWDDAIPDDGGTRYMFKKIYGKNFKTD